MTIEIALVISIVSVAFSIFFGLKAYNRNSTKDIEERVRENTKINLKLDEISASVRELKTDMTALKNDVQKQNDRIIIVEASAKQAHKRIDAIERKLEMKGED